MSDSEKPKPVVFEIPVPPPVWGSLPPREWHDRWRVALGYSDWTPRVYAGTARDFATEHEYTITEQVSDDLVRVVDTQGRDVAIGRHPDTGALALVLLA